MILRRAFRYRLYPGAEQVARLESCALNVKNMTRSAKGTVEAPGTNVAAKAGLNRAILDSGWSRFVEQCRYKVIPLGGRVIEVLVAYSSQTCSACGYVDAGSRREQAVFLCVHCGHFDNADLNAARVLLTRGLAKLAVEATATGCGGTATGRPAKQQLHVARRGPRQSVGALVIDTKAPRFSKG